MGLVLWDTLEDDSYHTPMELRADVLFSRCPPFPPFSPSPSPASGVRVTTPVERLPEELQIGYAIHEQ